MRQLQSSNSPAYLQWRAHFRPSQPDSEPTDSDMRVFFGPLTDMLLFLLLLLAFNNTMDLQ